MRLCGLAIAWAVICTEGLCFFTPHATTCILFFLLVTTVYSDLLLLSLLLSIAFTLLPLCVSRTHRAYPVTPASSWLSLDRNSSALDRDRFLVIAMVCIPFVMFRSFPTEWDDLRENPACMCPDSPSRTLPPRPSSGLLRFSRLFSVLP